MDDRTIWKNYGISKSVIGKVILSTLKKNIMTGGLIEKFIEWVIHNGGLYVLLFIIFAETGLFVGFFLPGDSLLFTAGIYSDDLAAQFFNIHFLLIIALVIVASVTGSMVGYWFGYKAGPVLYERRDSFFFKRKYLIKAKSFYEKNGKSTIFFSKFLPIIRTFAPIVGGVIKMKRNTFTWYNIAGSTCWVSILMLSGHYLQDILEKKYGFSLKDHIEGITIAIVLITTLPVLWTLLTNKTTRKTIDQSPN